MSQDAYRNTIAEALTNQCGYCRGNGQIMHADGKITVCRFCSGTGHAFSESDVRQFLFDMAKKPDASSVIAQTAHLISLNRNPGASLRHACTLIEYLDKLLKDSEQRYVQLLRNGPPPIIILKDKDDSQ